MPDASQYFSAIQTEKARLDRVYPDGCLYVMSVRNLGANSTAGTVSEVSTKIAAKHFVENTAREASKEEIADFKARAKAFSERMQAVSFTNHKRHDSSGVTHIIREK